VLPPLDVARLRRQFPALERRVGGRAAVYFDGPAGSQVPRRVVDAMARYLIETNANCGGPFVTSRESDERLRASREALADLLGSGEPDLVVFGPNMTTLTLALGRALSRTWAAGDEVLLTRLEHDANFTPWVLAARDAGAVARHVAVRVEDCTLDLDGLHAALGPRTRLVAVGAASNAVGTINPVREIVAAAHAAGALVFVDAVHYAPHAPIDVAAWECDFLVCSAYKFFGPHLGILWGRRELLERLPVYKLRPPSDELPGRWMTGTQCHEAIAGTAEAIEYLAELGRERVGPAAGRRAALLAAYDAIRAHERRLSGQMLEQLSAIRGLRIHGIRDPARLDERVPTFAFTHERHAPRAIAERLADQGIFVWHGNHYALPLTEALGLEPDGVVRAGLLHYNTVEEIGRLREALERM
jgi:cysteine desulfurase family protein (TIGR01976 family)